MPSVGTVLVVEDDASIRLLCRINLELDGYRVLEAGTSAEARTAVADEEVRVVLLDLRLGTDDARPIAAQVRRERPDVGLVLLTGDSDTAGIEADAVLTKPFDLNVFRAAVARAAERATRAGRDSDP